MGRDFIKKVCKVVKSHGLGRMWRKVVEYVEKFWNAMGYFEILRKVIIVVALQPRTDLGESVLEVVG